MKIKTLDHIVEHELHTDMADKKAGSRIQRLFISYKSILCTRERSCIIEDNGKIAVYHVLSAICAESLSKSRESDLDMAHDHLRKTSKSS